MSSVQQSNSVAPGSSSDSQVLQQVAQTIFLQEEALAALETEMEVLVKALWHGIPVRALPVEVFYPTRNKRVTHFHTWSDNARIVRVYTRLMLMRLFWPLFRPRQRLPEP